MSDLPKNNTTTNDVSRPQTHEGLIHLMKQRPGFHPCQACLRWTPHRAPSCASCGASQAEWYERWFGYFQQRQALIRDVAARVDTDARHREAEPRNPNPPGWHWDRGRARFIPEDQFQRESNNFLWFALFCVVGLFVMVAFMSCGVHTR